MTASDPNFKKSPLMNIQTALDDCSGNWPLSDKPFPRELEEKELLQTAMQCNCVLCEFGERIEQVTLKEIKSAGEHFLPDLVLKCISEGIEYLIQNHRLEKHEKGLAQSFSNCICKKLTTSRNTRLLEDLLKKETASLFKLLSPPRFRRYIDLVQYDLDDIFANVEKLDENIEKLNKLYEPYIKRYAKEVYDKWNKPSNFSEEDLFQEVSMSSRKYILKYDPQLGILFRKYFQQRIRFVCRDKARKFAKKLQANDILGKPSLTKKDISIRSGYLFGSGNNEIECVDVGAYESWEKVSAYEQYRIFLQSLTSIEKKLLTDHEGWYSDALTYSELSKKHNLSKYMVQKNIKNARKKREKFYHSHSSQKNKTNIPNEANENENQ